MNVLSLFDGMSCGQIALKRAGIKVDKYYSSEIDKYAIKVTQANFHSTIQLGDIAQVSAKKLPTIDLLIGGSPCQGFSFAGKQLNFSDPRSALFFEYVRLLKECKPRYFLLENVRMKKEYQDVISEALGVQPIRINSNLVSAQNRDRYYWTNIKCVDQPQDEGVMLEDIIELDNAESLIDVSRIKKTWDTKNYLQYDLSGKVYKSQDQRAYKLNGKHGALAASRCASKVKVLLRDKSKCVRSGGRGSYDRHEWDSVDNLHIRKLSVIECERLQTVPDNYTNSASNTQRYKMLGNCWTVDVIAHILRYIA